MAKNYREKEIDGHEVLVQQFPATEGLLIAQKLAKLLGGALAESTGLLSGGAKTATELLDSEINPDMISSIIESLVDKLEGEATVNLVKRMLKSTQINGQEVKDNFDVFFMGRYQLLFKTLIFVVEVNFRNFTEGESGGQ